MSSESSISIALATEGDAESADRSFSGTAHSLLTHLRATGHRVTAVDAEVYGARKLLLAARVFSRDRARWRTAFRLGAAAHRTRSAVARAALGSLPDAPQVVLQMGATFEPPARPYALYCDWNQRLAARFAASGLSPVSQMTPAEAQAIDAREARIYAGAGAVFTISERLRRAFVDDYGLPPERVAVAYPGPNLDLARLPVRAQQGDGPPTLLFVGKEFRRKGGDVLLHAFARVRAQVPGARLRIVGPTTIDAALPDGAELVGPLRKDVPEEWSRLVAEYAAADVFTLPTRYEPLGIVVIEAMYFGLPCVTSDVWAMPEMVVEGETGHLVPVDDADALADRLASLLADRARARRLGEAGRARAHARFSWETSARIIGDRLAELARAPRAERRPAG